MNKGLQITLYVVCAYLLVFGLLFLLAPGLAAQVMSTTLPDKALNMLYGQMMLTFAYVAFLAARGGEGLTRLSRVVLVLTPILIFSAGLLYGDEREYLDGTVPFVRAALTQLSAAIGEQWQPS